MIVVDMADSTQEDLIDIAKNDPDWKARRNAVLEISDDDALKNVFRNDSVVMVKIAALGNIEDTDFLCDECLNNPQGHIRHAILNRILDENLLCGDELNSLLTHLTLNDPELIVSQIACRNLSDENQEVFVRVANINRDETIRCEAVSKIRDEVILMHFAINDENRFVRLEAIQNPNLKDIDTFTFAIIDDEDKFNRFMALSRILDADALFDIIFYEPLHPRLAEISQSITFSLDEYFMRQLENCDDDYHKIVAVNFLQNRHHLENIIKNTDNEMIIADAIKNRHFKNQKILHELIKTDSHPEVILAVADKIDDESLIIDYVKNHLDSDVSRHLIFKITDLDFLRHLLQYENLDISNCAARRLIEQGYYLFEIAVNYPLKDIRLEAIGKISSKYDLVLIALKTEDRDIAIAALNAMVADKLIKRYMPSRSIITDSLDEIIFRSKLDDLVADEDREIQKLAISKLNRKEKLDEIIYNEKDSELVDAARMRLDTLWQDLKLIDDEDVLCVIAEKGDYDIKSRVKIQIEDLNTWRDRISKINDITDINQLKDIANNDYNYYVRCEAEGKLENLIFNIRLDEIGLTKNQEKFKSIACDETYPSEIRKKAFLNINDVKFNC